MFRIGKKIGSVELVKVIGEGASGKVYKGESRIKGDVAVKVLSDLKGRFAKEYKQGILNPEEIFLQEIAANEKLRNHKNIAFYHFSDKIDDGIYIIQELIDGWTFDEYVNKHNPSEQDIIDILREIAYGLQDAHSLKVTHNDIKPSNIMISKKGEVKLIDFGVGNSGYQDVISKCLPFCSPELIIADLDSKKLNLEERIRSDLWALNVTAYNVLTKRLPFESSIKEWSRLSKEERDEQEEELKNKILYTKNTPIKKLKSDINKGLEFVIEKGLAKVSQERYQDTEEMIEDLHPRICLARDYQDVDPLDHDKMDELIEKFLMSLDEHPPFEDKDIAEGKFPYGIQIGEKEFDYAKERSFCAGPLIKYLGLMHVLTGKDHYLDSAKRKMKELISNKERIFDYPVSTAWAFNQGAGTLFYLTKEKEYADLIKEAASEMINRHFDKEEGYFKNLTENSNEMIFSSNLYFLNQLLWQNHLINKGSLDELERFSKFILENSFTNGRLIESFRLDQKNKIELNKKKTKCSISLARCLYACTNMYRITKNSRINDGQYNLYLEFVETIRKNNFLMPYELTDKNSPKDTYSTSWSLLALAKLSLNIQSKKIDEYYYQTAKKIMNQNFISREKGILKGSINSVNSSFEILAEADIAFSQALMLPILKKRKKLDEYRWIYKI